MPWYHEHDRKISLFCVSLIKYLGGGNLKRNSRVNIKTYFDFKLIVFMIMSHVASEEGDKALSIVDIDEGFFRFLYVQIVELIGGVPNEYGGLNNVVLPDFIHKVRGDGYPIYKSGRYPTESGLTDELYRGDDLF